MEEQELSWDWVLAMIQHDYTICNADTDSISFCKPDKQPFTEEEIRSLVDEINRASPEYMIWENDGYYDKVIVLKAKNYVLYTKKDDKLVKKGSALKSATLEPQLKKFLEDIILSLIHDNHNLQEIYYNYIRQAINITDITPWAKKITISERTKLSERANETKIIDALTSAGKTFQEGDKFYIFYLPDNTIKLAENFDGVYDKVKMLEKLYKVTERFESILPIQDLFLNFTLTKHQDQLFEITGQRVKEKKRRSNASI